MPEILSRCRRWLGICIFFGLLGIATLVPQKAAASDTENEFEGQEILFLLEEAYTQEKGEWQIGASLNQSLEGPDERAWELEVEYGITNRLQLFVELPFVDSVNNTGGIGDPEIGLDYALMKDTGGNIPEFTVGAAIMLPTGDNDNGPGMGGFGYQLSARISKALASGIFVHGLAEYEAVPDARQDGADLSLREYGFGAGFAYAPIDDLYLITEYLWAKEREKQNGFTETEVEQLLSFGVTYEFANDISIGLGGAVGLNSDSESKAFALAQWEF
ncbi:transporter [Sphingorhabdus sp. Alg231-15]|uniref:transporter n=1 Tax=Sphingorhabdus sp. Alg231-15 TaxID=1922222 RepID=UPI000D562C45